MKKCHVIGYRKGDIDKNRGKNTKWKCIVENLLIQKTVYFISKCCVFIHYQLKIHDGNRLREWTFQNFKRIFLKINSTFSVVQLQIPHSSTKNKAGDLLLISICRLFHLV